MVTKLPSEQHRLRTTGQNARAIHELVENRRLFAVFQPIIDLGSGTPFAYESFARSHDPDFQSPDVMFRRAVDEKSCGLLGRTLRTLAVENAPDAPLFLNIHPHEFDEGFLVRTDDAMFYHFDQIYLEVTESVPLSHFTHCHGVLQEIRNKGMRLAIDDLGAGYSNLIYIAELAPEIVKLDMALVRNLERSKRKQKVVRSICLLCEELGARVVAEGIETEEELAAVIDCGAHYGQGYLIARPACPAPAVSWPC